MDIATCECPHCHAEMFEGAHFCIRCGGRLDEPKRAVPSQRPVAPLGDLFAPPPSAGGGAVRDVGVRERDASLNEIDQGFGALAPAAQVALPLPRQSLGATLPFGVVSPAAPPVAVAVPVVSTAPPLVAPPVPGASGATVPVPAPVPASPLSAAAPLAAPSATEMKSVPARDAESPRRQSTMAEHSRDEVLRRARLKQSMKRAGLAGIDLSGASLEGVDFARADLEGANLTNAKLSGACLKSANLRNAKLAGADLSQADLDKAELEGAELEGANLTGANLKRATLEAADLEGANLTGARLGGAELIAATLGRAILRGADLSQAELTEAELQNADLTGANLSGANLQGSNLDGAQLPGAILNDADLRGASALGANFEGAQLERACLENVGLGGALLRGIDARHATFAGAKLEGALLNAAKVAGANFMGAHVAGVVLDSLDKSPLGDGSMRLDAARALALLRGEELIEEHGSTRYFGKGDVLRDATLEFGEGSRIHIDSRFDNCSITLREGAELTIGEWGVLKDCAIVGHGRIIVHGRFFERQSPGIVGVRSLFVSARGGVVGGVEQVEEGTQFAFEPGCRLRMKILRPRMAAAAE